MTTKTEDGAAAGDAPLLTTKELAARLKVGTFTVREWRRLGLITPAVHLNRVMRWRLDDVLTELERARASQ